MTKLDQETPDLRRPRPALPFPAAVPEPSESQERAAAERSALAALERGERDRALSLLMDMCGKALYRFCCYMVRDPSLAEDVVQTVFLQAYKSMDRFEGRSSFRTWLMSIAHHRCLDAIKSRRRRERIILPDAELPARGSTEDPAARMHFMSSLEHCLAELGPAAREAVVLRYVEGLSYPEMEQICGEKAATLQMRVSRALPLLRRCLESKGVQP